MKTILIFLLLLCQKAFSQYDSLAFRNSFLKNKVYACPLESSIVVLQSSESKWELDTMIHCTDEIVKAVDFHKDSTITIYSTSGVSTSKIIASTYSEASNIYDFEFYNDQGILYIVSILYYNDNKLIMKVKKVIKKKGKQKKVRLGKFLLVGSVT